MVGTSFLCQDQGSCNPRLMRSTTYAIPHAADMIKQSEIPIALSISPLADLRSDEVNISESFISETEINFFLSWNRPWLILVKQVQ